MYLRAPEQTEYRKLNFFCRVPRHLSQGRNTLLKEHFGLVFRLSPVPRFSLVVTE